MFERITDFDPEELTRRVMSYVFTFIRAAHAEPGMADWLGKMRDTFTEEEQDILNILAPEYTKLFIKLCDITSNDPVEMFETLFYKNLDNLEKEEND